MSPHVSGVEDSGTLSFLGPTQGQACILHSLSQQRPTGYLQWPDPVL